MDTRTDNLKNLINKIRTVGFFERLFGWKKIRDQVVDAVADLQNLITKATNLSDQLAELQTTNLNLAKDLEISKGTNERLGVEQSTLKSSSAVAEGDITRLKATLSSKETTVENQTLTIERLEGEIRLWKQENEHLSTANAATSEDLGALRESNHNLNERKNELEVSLESSNRDLVHLRQERNDLSGRVVQFLAEEESRKSAHEAAVSNLKDIKDRIQDDRNQEIEDRNRAEIERIIKLKETWSLHQETVKSAMKILCNRLAIEYVGQVPFKGTPDNAIKICEEFIVFDAKSPAGEDLKNFPVYIRGQAENAKKYAKLENVKPVVYFVVPTNTLESLNQYVFDLADYQVHVIASDSLEQILLSLKKIEEYEFIEFLSPEERDAVCRVYTYDETPYSSRSLFSATFDRSCV